MYVVSNTPWHKVQYGLENEARSFDSDPLTPEDDDSDMLPCWVQCFTSDFRAVALCSE